MRLPAFQLGWPHDDVSVTSGSARQIARSLRSLAASIDCDFNVAAQYVGAAAEACASS